MTGDVGPERHGSENNRDDAGPLTDAERARRYRARKRGEDVPRGHPGRPTEPEPSHAERALQGAGILYGALGWLHPEDVDPMLGFFLDFLAEQVARLRPSRTAEKS